MRDTAWLIWVIVPTVFFWVFVFFAIQIYIHKKIKGYEKQLIVEATEELIEKRENEAMQKRQRILAMKKAKGKILTYKIDSYQGLDKLLKDFTKIKIDGSGDILYYRIELNTELDFDVVSIQAFYQPVLVRGISFDYKTETEVLELFDDMLMNYFEEHRIIEESSEVSIICAVIIKHEYIDESKKEFYYNFKGYMSNMQRLYNLCAIDIHDSQVYYFKKLHSDTGDEVNLHDYLVDNLCLKTTND